MSSLSRSRILNTETSVPMSRPTGNTMIRQLPKVFRVGSRLNPLHCGKSCRGAVPIRNPMPEVQFQFVILCAEGEEM